MKIIPLILLLAVPAFATPPPPVESQLKLLDDYLDQPNHPLVSDHRVQLLMNPRDTEHPVTVDPVRANVILTVSFRFAQPLIEQIAHEMWTGPWTELTGKEAQARENPRYKFCLIGAWDQEILAIWINPNRDSKLNEVYVGDRWYRVSPNLVQLMTEDFIHLAIRRMEKSNDPPHLIPTVKRTYKPNEGFDDPPTPEEIQKRIDEAHRKRHGEP